MPIMPIALPHDGRTVHGKLYLPEMTDPVPAVVLSHGYNGCMTDFDAAARLLMDNGIAALCYTFCGGSTRDESGFPSTSMTLFTERDDCLALLDHLRSHPAIDPKQVFLFGGSMGGLVSVLASAERPDGVAGVGLLYPALCVADDWRGRFPEVSDIPETVDFWGLELGRVFFTAMRDLDVFTCMGYAGPVRIWQGDKDPVVKMADSERAVRTYADAALTVFPGEGHGFSPKAQAEVDHLLLAFVKAQMQHM